MVSRALRALVTIALVLTARVADAAPRLSWSAPPGCPLAERVREAYRELSDGAANDTSVGASAAVRADGDRFALHLELSSDSGSSTLDLAAARCETLADVVALQMALAADAARVVAMPVATRGPFSRRVPMARLGIAGAAGVSVGPLPGAALGLRVLARLSLPFLGIEAGAGYLFPRSAHYGAPHEGVGADLDLTFGALRACSPRGEERVTLDVCAGANMGSLRATGSGLAPSFTTRQLWSAFTLSPGVTAALTPEIALHGEIEASLAVTRPEVHARNLDTLFVAERAGVSCWLGASASF